MSVEISLKDDLFYGRMSDCSISAQVDGPCGDDMEFYINFQNGCISEIKYYTETGCRNTLVAGRGVASRVLGKDVYSALEINPAIIIKEESKLTKGGQHCAILAVTTFYKAIAMYLLQIGNKKV